MGQWSVSASTITAQAQAALFAREVWREARVNSFWNAFMGEGPNNVIHVKRDFMKEKGDQLHYNLVADLTQKGRAGSAQNVAGATGHPYNASTLRLEQNEEAPSVLTDTVALDQLRHAVLLAGKLSEQRLAFEMRPEVKNTLSYWWTRIGFDEVIFKKLSGVTFTDQGGNTFGEAAAANTNVIYGGGKTAKADLTASDTFTVDLLMKAKTAAMVGRLDLLSGSRTSTTIWRIRPMIIGGKPYYGCVLHPFHLYDLQRSQEWNQAHREVQGLREHNDNPIFTGAAGIWNGVVIYSHDKVVTGTNAGPSSDVAYADALFFGLQAGIWAEAQQAPDWVEKLFDYDDMLGVATGMMFGFDKTQFNISSQATDFAVIKIQTAANAAA